MKTTGVALTPERNNKMNMIVAFLPPHRLDPVARSLQRLANFPGMTVTEAKGHGHEKVSDEHDSRAQLTDFTPTVRIETIVRDALVEPVLEAIFEAAHTGTSGDGKIYVLPVLDAMRIKTGMRGESAV